MNNKIEDLRNHLFATLEALQDDKNPMDIDRARAIADVGQVLVNSARAEIDFLKVTMRTDGSPFLAPPQPAKPAPIAAGAKR